MSTEPTIPAGTAGEPQAAQPSCLRGWRPSRNAVRIGVFAVAVAILIIAGEMRPV
ncbi:hypothetical protein [Streptomyces sp. Wb2n-11]|uniref:hypothetical protein n=1 Tax=Streptomyces sp. Wb2n-11 TaxID=1030533 RepID=UPI00159EC5B3|nr:hypothetical protein [Streptomyces sp. Wb2n-11]